jgi:hypothetical protein
VITPGHAVADSIAVGAPWAPRAGVCPQTPRSPDFDSDSTVVDAPDPALARQIAEVLEAAVPHPWIGRQLFGLFRRAGQADVRVMPHAICLPGAAVFAVYQQLNREPSTGPCKPARSAPGRRRRSSL